MITGCINLNLRYKLLSCAGIRGGSIGCRNGKPNTVPACEKIYNLTDILRSMQFTPRPTDSC